MKIKILLTLLFFFILKISFANTQEKLIKEVIKLVPNGSVILTTPHKKNIISYKPHRINIPASLLKIFLSVAAMDILGTEYKFSTEFYTNDAKDFLLVGSGDPYLISEEIRVIAQNIRKMGYTNFRSFNIDDSLLQDTLMPGISASLRNYDTLNGAAVVNFNTMYLHKTKKGVLKSAEEQTPLTPLALTKKTFLKNGEKKRFKFSHNYNETLEYTNQLFQTVFSQENIIFHEKNYKKNNVNENWQKIYTHYNTRNLIYYLENLLLYSNNYLANQIFLKLGEAYHEKPQSLKKSQEALLDYAQRNFSATKKNFLLEEGSGISRNNKMTCHLLIEILNKFQPHHRILPQDFGVRLKTGTLKGIYNLAGYIPANNQLYPFCIMTQAKTNKRLKVLKLLKQIVILQ